MRTDLLAMLVLVVLLPLSQTSLGSVALLTLSQTSSGTLASSSTLPSSWSRSHHSNSEASKYLSTPFSFRCWG